MSLSPGLPAFEDAFDEALYQEIDYLVKPEKEDLLTSPGVFHAIPSVHKLAVGYLQQEDPSTNPTSH